MNTAERKDYQNELLEIARNTKNALFAEWEASASDKKYFKDKHIANKMNKRGLLPEGIGATTVLLLLAAFGKSVFSDEDLEKCNKIINSAFVNIREWSKDGYLATPILSAENGRKAFNEDAGYVDTVTWCLSSAILARYNQKQKLLQLEPGVEEYVFDAIAKGIFTLCDAQKDGRWGFRTDTTSQRSLYFTYSAAASIADFFDYVLGEVALLSLPAGATDKEKSEAITDACDKDVIDYINDAYGCNIVDKVTESRKSLCRWIVRDALPLFPRIASCDPLDKATLDLLGMWPHGTYEKDSTPKVFYHLYYTYYLLDMMVTAGADTYFLEIVENLEELKALAQYYENNKRLNATDKFYYFYDLAFEEADIKRGMYHYDEFFNKTVECALYTARSQYTNAAKTGKDFWESAELDLQFNHQEEAIAKAVQRLPFKDPSVIAMALRANITYSYYVTETQDIAIERLFDEMCADIYSTKYREKLNDSDRMDKDEECVIDLWDRTNYSLPLTERAVEALVDFKDYLDKFYNEPAPAVKQIESVQTETKIEYVTEPSALDKAVEAKIEEYLKGEEGIKIIETAVSSRIATLQLSDNANVAESSTQKLPKDEMLVKWMEETVKILSQSTDVTGVRDGLLEQMIALFDKLHEWSFRQAIDEDRPKGWTSVDVANVSRDYEIRRKKLLWEIGKDVKEKNTMYDLEELYSCLKKLRDK